MANDYVFSGGRDRNKEWHRSEYSTRLWDCDRYDITLQQLIGLNNQDKFGAVLDGDGCTIKWMYEHNRPTSAFVGALPPGVSEGKDCYGTDVYPIVEIPVDRPQDFHRYMVVKACVPNDAPICDSDSEQPSGTSESLPFREPLLYVEDRDCTRNILYVRQGFAGTPAVAIPEGTEICPMYTVAPECPEPVSTSRSGYTAEENYLQRFYSGYDYTERATRNYYEGGITFNDELEKHRRQLFGGSNLSGSTMTGTLPLQLEQALFNGIGYKGDTEGMGRMKGLWSFGIPHYCLKSLNYQDLKQIFLDMDNAGANIGSGNYMIIGSNEAQNIMDEWAACRPCNSDMSNMSYGYGINQINTTWGDAMLTRHRGRALKPNQLLIIDMNKLQLYIQQDWMEKEIIGGTNLCRRFEIWGEFSLLLACPCHHAIITIDNDCFTQQCCDPNKPCLPYPSEPTFCEPGVVVPEAMMMAAPEMC